MAAPRNEELATLAQRVADALAAEIAEEVVLTGSVSRGMADEVSDLEMLVMTEQQLDTVRLAPSGPNVDRARTWLADGVRILR